MTTFIVCRLYAGRKCLGHVVDDFETKGRKKPWWRLRTADGLAIFETRDARIRRGQTVQARVCGEHLGGSRSYSWATCPPGASGSDLSSFMRIGLMIRYGVSTGVYLLGIANHFLTYDVKRCNIKNLLA